MKLKNQQIKTVLFDLGGVLIDIDYPATIHQMKKIGLDNFENLYTQHSQTNMFNAFETGKISPFLFLNSLLEISKNRDTTPNQLVHAWNAMIGDFRIHQIQLLQNIRKHYKLALLSNTNSIHYELVMRNWKKDFSFDFNSLFDEIFLSHEIGFRKPDASCFEFVLKQLHTVPENTLFIDDSIQHIEGAKKLGIYTCHYQDRDSLLQFFS